LICYPWPTVQALSLYECYVYNLRSSDSLTWSIFYLLPQDIGTVELAATGLYHSFWYKAYGFSSYWARYECLDDALLTSPKPNNASEVLVTLNPDAGINGSSTWTTWKNMWAVISGANKLIAGTPLPTDEVEAEKYRSVLAEAHFMRALSYFFLVR